jgi:DNA-binding XRE family transcriptional regulator
MIGTVAGVKLAQCRRLRFLSQDALAEKAGVAKTTLVQIELGRVKPQLRIVQRLSEALEVDATTVDEFRPSLGLPPLPPDEG